MSFKLLSKTLFITLFSIVTVLPSGAFGAVFCVNTADQFTSALDAASSNREDNTIKLSKGEYLGTFVYATTTTGKLSIVGGYSRSRLTNVNPVWIGQSPPEDHFLIKM